MALLAIGIDLSNNYAPCTKKVFGGEGGMLVSLCLSVCLSIRLSVRPSRILCLLCDSYISG